MSSALGANPHHTAEYTAPSSSPRREIPLNEGWRFLQASDPANAMASEFDDAQWEKVSLPHTWNRVGLYEDAAKVGVHRPAMINKLQGPGWYRVSLTPPRLLSGQRAWLEFDAASRTAEVWLNGIKLGSHAGGFSRFRFDATNVLRVGAPNILVVKTDNSPPRAGSLTANTFPLMGDFFVHGGLYRPARLIVTEATHFDMLDHGSPGVYARTTRIADGQANVAVIAKLSTSDRRMQRVSVHASLIHPDGTISSRASTTTNIKPGIAIDAGLSLDLANPHLWHGTKDPFLYRLVVELRDSKGKLLDRYDRPFGVREIRLDPQKGFFLNGENIRLFGVGLHQDREGMGWDTVIPQTIRASLPRNAR
ncbi:sugar-binding domain-containing protein [Novosphingobium sp. 17-62-19]|uniref:glycoside hydrolase family 2 protein n=1 Tax=Novosphingobium sp. 17-62-19 TaxID=1970406 RepID=UPI0025CF95FE|nr:sugar-binding domain-containing protein [Novosphingobium sp. 17-62-19]HQS96091.1 hypothetical protein [Novosphingobium sp.]